MFPINHLISQSSLDISLIWTPVIIAKVKKLQLRSVQSGTICVFMLVPKICWIEATVLQIEPTTTYGKYKKSTNLSLTDSQPSLGKSTSWVPVITAEAKLPLHPV
jgi:hypothetical protein